MKIVNQMQEGVEKPRPKVQWEVGELVRIKEGPFTDFNGAVEDVNYDKSQGRASSVTIFGRATPVELDFAQVEKVRASFGGRLATPSPRTVAAGDETPVRGAEVASPWRSNSTGRRARLESKEPTWQRKSSASSSCKSRRARRTRRPRSARRWASAV